MSLICGSLRWLFDEIQSWKDEYEELLKPFEVKIDPKYSIFEKEPTNLRKEMCRFSFSENWLKRVMKKKEEETRREKRRVKLFEN